jgi:hypothetical protein
MELEGRFPRHSTCIILFYAYAVWSKLAGMGGYALIAEAMGPSMLAKYQNCPCFNGVLCTVQGKHVNHKIGRYATKRVNTLTGPHIVVIRFDRTSLSLVIRLILSVLVRLII